MLLDVSSHCSFLLLCSIPCTDITTLYIHSSVDEHLGYFQFRAIMGRNLLVFFFKKPCIFSVIWCACSSSSRKFVLCRIRFPVEVQLVGWVFDISQETMHIIIAPLIFLFKEEMRPPGKANGWDLLDPRSRHLFPRRRPPALRGASTGHCAGGKRSPIRPVSHVNNRLLEQRTISPTDTITTCFDC